MICIIGYFATFALKTKLEDFQKFSHLFSSQSISTKPFLCLKVVSFYSDLDMDEGVVIPVEDFVEAYNEGDWYDWGGYGGASAAAGRPHQRPHHRPNRTVTMASAMAAKPVIPSPGGRKLTPQPWLEPRQNTNFHDFQLLWTDEALGTLPVMTSGLKGMGEGPRVLLERICVANAGKLSSSVRKTRGRLINNTGRCVKRHSFSRICFSKSVRDLRWDVFYCRLFRTCLPMEFKGFNS